MKHLYRKYDGERFTKQSDGKYTMNKSMMGEKYRYTYAYLKSHGFVDSLAECVIIDYDHHYDGHGNFDD